MAKIHFVKSGKRPNGERLTQSHDIPIEHPSRHLSTYETRFFSYPPTFNQEVLASDFSSYKYVVLEIGIEEVNSLFPKPGFYYFLGLDVSDCKEILGISGALI